MAFHEAAAAAAGTAVRVLVVEDDDAIRDLLGSALRFAGFDVTTVATGYQALVAAGRDRPDLVVLDVNLPDVDGFEVCRRLRSEGDWVPIIFLTARRDAEDVRQGLAGGGDDYLTKPFSLEELALRIEAVLRRSRPSAPADSSVLRCADLVLDQDAHRVWRGVAEAHLTPTEYALLRYLLLNAGRVVSRQQILDRVWDYDFDGTGRIIETNISALRRKVDHGEPALIRTVRGVGYTIRDPARDR